MIYVIRRFKRMRDRLRDQGDYTKEMKDIQKLVQAANEMESDLTSTPRHLKSVARRIKHNMPKGHPFLLHVEADEMLTRLVAELDAKE